MATRSLATVVLSFSLTVLILTTAVHLCQTSLPSIGRLGEPESQFQPVRRQGIAPGVPLRILPIGDSITEGHGSSDGNGYRLYLRDRLIDSGALSEVTDPANPAMTADSLSGSNVDFIGTQTSGANNTDNQNEGYGGRNITGITQYVTTDGILYQHPNIVLIHAGTNDLDVQPPPNQPYATAPDRLGALVDAVLCECPDSVVLVAMLIDDEITTGAEARTELFNAAVPNVVAQRYARGYKVQVVNQTDVDGVDLIDGLHPNDWGYAMMAMNWFQALQSVPDGWITPPRAPTAPSATVDFDACSAAPLSSSTSSQSTVQSTETPSPSTSATSSSSSSSPAYPTSSNQTPPTPSTSPTTSLSASTVASTATSTAVDPPTTSGALPIGPPTPTVPPSNAPGAASTSATSTPNSTNAGAKVHNFAIPVVLLSIGSVMVLSM